MKVEHIGLGDLVDAGDGPRHVASIDRLDCVVQLVTPEEWSKGGVPPADRERIPCASIKRLRS